MKLSIIVTIYNVAPYLRKCVDSLLMQDITDYEIILVDDGSTDDSGAIADELLSAFRLSHFASRLQLRVIHQSNAGLSAARNTGIAAATGEYIMFVDSDDYLQPNVLGTLLAQVEQDQLDVLRFRMQNVRESGEFFVPHEGMKTNYNDYSSVPTDGLTFLNERMYIQCYAVQFILRRELALQEGFTPDIYFEDTDWTPRMLLRAKRVASTELVVYNYLWREGSITLSHKDIAKQRKQLRNKIDLLRKLNDWGKAVPDRRWFDSMISGLLLNIVGMIASTFYSDRREYIRQIQAIGILPITTYHIAPRAHRKVRLVNISLPLAVWVMRWRK